MTLRVFALSGGIIPWGDYGNVLANGLVEQAVRPGGRDGLIWAAPDIVPVMFPDIRRIVVPEQTLQALEKACLRLMSRPMPVVKVVRIEWMQWHHASRFPPLLPETGDPIDYLMAPPHDPRAAALAPAFHELLPTAAAHVSIRRDWDWRPGLSAQEEAALRAPWDVRRQHVPDGAALFHDPEGGPSYVSEPMAEALRPLVGDWCDLTEVAVIG